jgi:hypothetical protein
MTTEKLSLHKKLAQVMYEAERIPKNGTAPREMGGYKFVQVGDAADYIRKELAAKGITMMPTGVRVVGQADRPTKSGGNMTTVDLITEWTLTDGDSGESITIMSFGSGADGGDKYSGKASTSAMKYALLTGFLLSTGEDTEGSNLPEQRAPSAHPGLVGTREHPIADTSRTPEGGMIGTAIAQGNHDMNLRQTPEGWVLPFRVKNGSSSFIVRAEGALAQALDAIKATVIDQRVTVWGRWSDETTPAKGVKPEIHYRVLHLDRIATPDGILPAPAFDSPDDLEQPPDDIELVGEAPSQPLGLVG